MSQETATSFFEAIRQNEALTSQLSALSGDVEAFARAAVEAGQRQGFVFDASDVRMALAAVAKQNAPELSEEDLSAVAGGFGSLAVGQNTGTCVGRYSEGCQTQLLVGQQITKGNQLLTKF
jgi:predicted ribosomally synthesized peptide with nif11-like leader